MTRSLPLLLIACVFASLAGGCRLSGWYVNYPENPLEGVASFAVAPIHGVEDVDPAAVGDALAAELLQCPNVHRVVRPRELMLAMERHDLALDSEGAVHALARILGVDAVVIAELTEYDPYHPPRIGIRAQLFVAQRNTAADIDVVSISRQGRAVRERELPGGNLIQIERVYDASQREIHHQAERYAFGHSLGEEALEGGDRVLWIQDMYFRFISYRVVGDLFERYREQREAAAAQAELESRQKSRNA